MFWIGFAVGFLGAPLGSLVGVACAAKGMFRRF